MSCNPDKWPGMKLRDIILEIADSGADIAIVKSDSYAVILIRGENTEAYLTAFNSIEVE